MEALLNALLGGRPQATAPGQTFGGGTIIDSDASAPNIGMRNASFAKGGCNAKFRCSPPTFSAWSRKIIFLRSTARRSASDW